METFEWIILRRLDRRRGFHPPRPMLRPTLGSGMILSWAGMRGIVTLAAAFAIPARMPDGSPFPYRDLIQLTASTVVFGTLVLQGLTMKPLIRKIGLTDNDPVGREVRLARREVYRGALASLDGDETLPAKLLRKEYGALVEANEGDPPPGDNEDAEEPAGLALRRKTITAARQQALALRQSEEIGDDAYNRIVEELDWADLHAGAGRTEEERTSRHCSDLRPIALGSVFLKFLATSSLFFRLLTKSPAVTVQRD